ncbi:MAG: SGNH/GDSL hydrolase family protein, partial [Bdellovibrionales bacterium]|nr:SGNH/GDSL hydrolase family protein [Bdellovibrionales bacterium]
MSLRLRSLFAGACLSLFGIAVSLGVIELGFRLIVPEKRLPTLPRPHFFYLPPGAVNFRDRPYPFEKPVQTFRTVVVGDSFTFGPGVQFDDSFPKRLETLLNYSKGPLRNEVLNFGESGYATVHEVKVLKESLKYSPDLILLQITLNDA